MIENGKKILCLSLKAKWYNMIESGEKKEEYREVKPFWIKRLFKHFDVVRFSYGYTKRTMDFECLEIQMGKGNPEWGAPKEEVFIIKLGKRLK